MQIELSGMILDSWLQILTNTYTANLAAFLTVDQLDQHINSVADLKGKSVATIAPYVGRLRDNVGIHATARDGAQLV